MEYTVNDFIKLLKNYPQDAEIRIRVNNEYSEIYYHFETPSIQKDYDDDGNEYLVIF